ncbi:MAG TPA: hypothetical protein VL463_36700 [Kofleriaceae bacterium]|jgi:hypothetical protein|nr:hypothetical protein [Kofleriaceae bacterium]
MRLPALLALALSLPACADQASVGTAEEDSANLDDRSGVDGSYYELDLEAGRAAHLPLSRVFYGTTSQSGSHTMRVRARCLPIVILGQTFQQAQDACDPGLVVVADTCNDALCASSTRNILYDNDSSSAGGNGKGAFLQTTVARTTTYRAIAYSHLRRGTSRVAVERSLDGTTWTTSWTDGANGAAISGATQIVGGTLVRLGPVANGDDVHVRTPDDGAGANSGTRLFVFDLAHDQFAFTDGPSSGDRDPVFHFDASWAGDSPLAIAAKDVATPSDGGPGLETIADLVRGPIGIAEGFVALHGGADCVGATQTNSATRVACTGGTTSFSPGRYRFYAYAHTDGIGVGTVVPGGEFPASATGFPHCNDVLRGHANDLAFTMSLVRDGNVVETRYIPRGAIGSEGFDDPNDPNDTPWDRFGFDVEVPADGVQHTYRIDIGSDAVHVRGAWGWTRNPEDVELKIASMNIEGHGNAQSTEMMKNLADLLGTRVTYDASGNIIDIDDHGRWQWDSDVIALQEVKDLSHLQPALDRLSAQTGHAWSRKFALGTWKDLPYPKSNYMSFAPVLADSDVVPSGGIEFSTAEMTTAGCTSETSTTSDDSFSCEVSDEPNGNYGDEHHYVVPTHVAVRRVGGAGAGSTSRPIAIFDWYLLDDDDKTARRREGVDNVIAKMKSLLASRPSAFNVDGATSPTWRGNRMIILGDSNMWNHQCSEVNESLAKLRREFGYAVEVSMAQLDWYHRTFDTHYSGAPLGDPDQGIYGSCTDPSWALEPSSMTSASGAGGCPFHFEQVDSWKGETSTPAPGDPTIETGAKYVVDPSQWYAWWAATSSGANGSSRLDTMILVGRGWAYDDPLLRYSTLSDSNFVSFVNDYQGGGVELAVPSKITSTCDASDHDFVTAGGSYTPSFGIYGGTTSEGQPALCSDHKPIGARLRITFAR